MIRGNAVVPGAMVIILAVLAAVAPATARSPRTPKPVKLPTIDSVTLNGTIQSVTPKEIVVMVNAPDKKDKSTKDAPQGTWIVASEPATKFAISATATADYLRGGLWVIVPGELGKQEVVGEVSELTVMPLRLLGQERSSQAKKGKDGEKTAEEAKSSQIVGKLLHSHDSKWSIEVDSKQYQMELAKDAQINVKLDLRSRRLIGAGDKIVVTGKAIHGQPGNCLADDIQVTLAKPLGKAKADKSSKPESGKEKDVREALESLK